MTHHYKTFSAVHTCHCGKEYSGEINKVEKLMNLHQKFCKDKNPTPTERVYQQFKISQNNPLSGNGEKEKQKAYSKKQLSPITQSNIPIEFKYNGKLYSSSGYLPINK